MARSGTLTTRTPSLEMQNWMSQGMRACAWGGGEAAIHKGVREKCIMMSMALPAASHDTHWQGDARHVVGCAVHGDRVVPVGQRATEKEDTLGIGDARAHLDRGLLHTAVVLDQEAAAQRRTDCDHAYRPTTTDGGLTRRHSAVESSEDSSLPDTYTLNAAPLTPASLATLRVPSPLASLKNTPGKGISRGTRSSHLHCSFCTTRVHAADLRLNSWRR